MENTHRPNTNEPIREVGGLDIIDPNDATSGINSDGTTKRKRGRPAGGTSGGSATKSSGKTGNQNQGKNSGNLTGIENLLSGIHIMLAAGTNIPELSISIEESKRLAAAINEVQKHYDFVIDTKVMAWVGLVTTCSSIYVPRIAAHNMRVKNEAKKEADKSIGKIDTENSQVDPTATYQTTLPISNLT